MGGKGKGKGEAKKRYVKYVRNLVRSSVYYHHAMLLTLYY